MRARLTLLFWLFLLVLLGVPSRAVAPASASEPEPVAPVPRAVSAPTVTLRAASGATIPFVAQNGEPIGGIPPETFELPHLVLNRNGTLGSARERTLILEVTGINVPPPGVTVTLEVETQHRDLDVGLSAQRISVWQASRWIANTTGITQTDVTATFVHEFGDTVPSAAGARTTPTDYFRYDLTVTGANHPSTDPMYRFSQDYAFLLENQWIARLPEVPESTAGAAPDELLVYYYDMVPFRRSAHEPATWLSREAVTGYVGAELVPALVEAFRVESDEWGFPWHDEWISYRLEDPERLSVALTDGRTWFHGSAPGGGHSAISLRVNGGNNTAYATLTDGLVSTFYHELFHNLQRNISLHSGGDGHVSGAGEAWRFFSEGTAGLAESVGQPRGQFIQAFPVSTYMSHANLFVQYGGGSVRDLNTSYAQMNPYRAAIYWRYLYEKCGGMRNGVEDPAAGMQVIRRALTALYSGEVVDPRSSTDLVGALPAVMDQALAGSSCPFQTYRESVRTFARAIYALRLDGARCVEPGIPDGCGFYDPYAQYREPPLNAITYDGTLQEYQGEIRGSYGIDLIEVHLDPAAGGQPLTLEFHGAPGTDAAFDVQILPLIGSGEGANPRHVSAAAGATVILPSVSSDGRVMYAISAIRTTIYDRLGLIITRLDAQEASDPTGAYTLVLRPGAGT